MNVYNVTYRRKDGSRGRGNFLARHHGQLETIVANHLLARAEAPLEKIDSHHTIITDVITPLCAFDSKVA